ncbi:M20/M25/M40 family metallo-hydrolase [Pseudoduganella violaceinigra]|uniref:M20/M25/M40 family metallo-hydrolase n=1 Tax=Pseudoduganella violaceinigra TaxID=246602 RepID=UPI000418F647|nr:M20/M25/M40 family metallo-hydrolase [Pseudoduganella violaceinigra]
MHQKLFAALLVGCSLNAGAASAPKKVWITLGDSAYIALKQIAPDATARESRSLATAHTFAGAVQSDRVHVVEVNETSLSELTHAVHEDLRRCGGYVAHDSYAEAVRALQAVTPAQVTAPSYAIDNQELVKPMLAQLQDINIGRTITDLSNFTNRYYNSRHGVAASDWIKANWSTLAAGRSDITVEQIAHTGWAQKSVMMTIKGQSKPDEIIVIGGHLDSIHRGSTDENAVAPGADDDASGIATMTEVIRVMTRNGYKPNRTIKFIGYSAEEVGLRGSKDIAQRFKAQNANVIGVLQLDMTNYQGAENDIYLFTDYTNAAQNDFLANLIKSYTPALKVGQDRCGYGCSDHVSWFNQGYPTSMPFEASYAGMNKNLHTVNDTFASMGSQAVHALKFAQLAMAYAVELGSDAAAPSTGGIDETHQGKLSPGQSVRFGPYKLSAGTRLSAELSGSGDADLYLRTALAPEKFAWDCRPYRGDSDEKCAVTSVGASEVFLMVDGYRDASYTLVVKAIK